MDSFELNKILGALLGTCLVLLSLNITAGAIFTPHKPEKPGYAIAVPEVAAGGAAASKEPAQPIEVLLAKASIEKGENSAKKCAACHTFEKNGPNRVGPNLYGIVDRPKASHAGFNYSAALKAKGGNWTYDELSHFLENPKGYIPGTNMAFAGLTRDSERGDVIGYMRTLADNPVPLPKVAEGQPAAPAGTQPAGAPAPAAAPAGTPPAAAKPQPGNSGATPNAQPGQAPKPH